MLTKRKLAALALDIRAWIGIFFLIRLVGITNAPLEIGHNWRQTITNMVARNFYQGNPNILFPQIDMGGNLTGIGGAEFPFFNYLIYLVSIVFDYSHWYGRLINLIVSSLGIYFFYRLIKEIRNQKTAFLSTIILLSSIWFAFSRKIMPDTFSVALVIIGLYYGYTWLTRNSFWRLFSYFLFITLGMLCKIPAMSLVAVVALLLVVKEIPLNKKLQIFTVTGISLLIVGAWYFYWIPYLTETYHYHLHFPKGLVEGANEILPYIPELLEKFYFSSLSSFIAFGIFLAGLFFLFGEKNRYLNYGLLFITAVFCIYILKTGAVFPTHNYYIIPFTPVMALVAGIGLSHLKNRYAYPILCLIAIEGIANQQHDFFIKESEKYKLTLEPIADTYIEKDKRIVINGGPSSQSIYFSNRKGWTIGNDSISPKTLGNLKTLGASYFIQDKHAFPEEINYFNKVYEDENYGIYSLEN